MREIVPDDRVSYGRPEEIAGAGAYLCSSYAESALTEYVQQAAIRSHNSLTDRHSADGSAPETIKSCIDGATCRVAPVAMYRMISLAAGMDRRWAAKLEGAADPTAKLTANARSSNASAMLVSTPPINWSR